MKIFAVILFAVLIICSNAIYPQKRILDRFKTDSNQTIIKSESVLVEPSIVTENDEKCTHVNYNFINGSGYGGIQKNIELTTDDNFQITFWVKGFGLINNFEIKFSDLSGDNVWWVNNRSYKFSNNWKLFTIKKRDIEFAWGPTNDKSFKSFNSIQFIIASVNGGKGSFFIKDLSYEKLPIEDNSPYNIKLSASSKLNNNSLVENIIDKNLNTFWKSSKNEIQSIIIDLNKKREYGGLIINWDEIDFAKNFTVLKSDDNINWEEIYKVTNSGNGKRFLNFKRNESKFIKLNFVKSNNGNGYSIKEIELKDYKYTKTKNEFYSNISANFRRGIFSKYLSREMSYWTIIGANSDTKEALINEEGMIEVDKGSFSIEPFISVEDSFYTWNDVKLNQSLENEYLPIPIVNWKTNQFNLESKFYAGGIADSSFVISSYKITNTSNDKAKIKFYLAIRPFQVNPPSQFLNLKGGVSSISSIAKNDFGAIVNENKQIYNITKSSNFGCTSFDESDIVEFISKNKIPQNNKIQDKTELASAAFEYNVDLQPGKDTTIYLGFPFHNYFPQNLANFTNSNQKNLISDELLKVKTFWEDKLNKFEITLPDSAKKITNTLKSNLAYILINRDKAGIQPGSRSYERSWIRDGSLTSSALLKMGIKNEVKEFLNWYSEFQFPSGKVPCVVDSRGGDPVPENDSHGQLIYAYLQYFEFTQDTLFLFDKFNHVIKAVNYINALSDERKTDKYRFGNDSLKAFYGILPESISHEGYSAKPMHSFWDDFFALKGLKDAVTIAQILKQDEFVTNFSKIRDAFRTNLYNSLNKTIEMHKINYIPGCVELGDFDATSTTIAITPVNEFEELPQPYLNNTFQKYFNYFKTRIDSSNSWNAYTPYELRIVGTFNYLNDAEKSHKLLDFFFSHQRPKGWNHWAEVVWNNAKAPEFIGDMPHTWVGSDYINAIRSFFVFENEQKNSLIIANGLKMEWINDTIGVVVKNLPTYYGIVNYSIKKLSDTYFLELDGDLTIPEGGIKVKNFWKNRSAIDELDSKNEINLMQNYIEIKNIPARIRIR